MTNISTIIEPAHEPLLSIGMGSVVTVVCRNIEEQGFPELLHDTADAVFLDLPGPWKVCNSTQHPQSSNMFW